MSKIHRIAYIPEEFAGQPFTAQHNPDCQPRWLVRLPNPKTGLIDLKPYCRFGIDPSEVTSDVIGFGRTFEEAAANALQAVTAERGA